MATEKIIQFFKDGREYIVTDAGNLYHSYYEPRAVDKIGWFKVKLPPFDKIPQWGERRVGNESVGYYIPDTPEEVKKFDDHALYLKKVAEDNKDRIAELRAQDDAVLATLKEKLK